MQIKWKYNPPEEAGLENLIATELTFKMVFSVHF